MNRVQLAGKISRVGQLQYSPSGLALLEFTLAVGQEAYSKESVGYYEVVVSDRLAEDLKGQLKIGMTVNIQTRLQDLNTASPCQFEILELYYTNFNSLIEKTLKEVFAVDRISVKCEWYDFSAIEKMKIFVKTHIEFLDTYKTNPLLQKIDGPEQTNLFPVDNLCMYTSKKCSECKQIFNFKFFFKNPPIGGSTEQTESEPSGPKSINLQDRCMSCYEKENGPSKQCSTCKEIKHVHNFVIDKTKKDGLTYDCKFCRKLSIAKIKDNFTQKNPNNGKKICEKCEKHDFLKNFYKINTINLTKIEYSAMCKKCYIEVNGPSKQCFRCKEIKKASSYCINKGNLDGLHCYCVDCCKIERNKKRHVDKIILYPDNFKKCIKCEKQINKKFFFTPLHI